MAISKESDAKTRVQALLGGFGDLLRGICDLFLYY